MQHIITSQELLGHAIRQARKRKGLTQAELGRLVGMQQAYVSGIEKGRHQSSFDTFLRLAAAVDLEFITQPKSKEKTTEW